MKDVRKETVVVVHGTWAGPSGAIKWWQPPDRTAPHDHFTKKLDAALARRGSLARCWAHCRPDSAPFSWSGANDWLDRTRASTSLLAYLKNLDEAGYRYHLVGHSHGGNAIADALPGLDPKTSNLASVVTLGTPFLDTHGPIHARKKRSERIVMVAAKVLVTILVVGVAGFMLIGGTSPMEREDAESTVSMIAIACAAAVGWWTNRRLKAAQRKFDEAAGTNLVGLAITSPYDEARQVLHHLRETQNPLAVAENRWSRLWRNVTSVIKQKSEISDLHGAATFKDLSRTSRGILIFFYLLIVLTPVYGILVQTEEFAQNPILNAVMLTAGLVLGNLFYAVVVSAFAGPKFYSAFLAPFRWLNHRLLAVASIPNEIATMVVRRNAWRVLQTYALGLQGYTYELPRVGVSPEIDGPWKFAAEELSPGATERAMRRRGDWLRSRLGDVSQALTALTLTATDIQVLLADISQDMTLVHAAYYTDDECIERIADWIAGTEAASAPAPARNEPSRTEPARTEPVRTRTRMVS